MNILLSALLLFTTVTHATTKVATLPGQASESFCELRAKFLGTSTVKLSGRNGREARAENAVYWILETLDSSDASCPRDPKISVRIRAADFKGKSSEPEITYPVTIHEPSRNQLVRIKIKFIQGKNTYLNRKYAEWIFAGLSND